MATHQPKNRQYRWASALMSSLLCHCGFVDADTIHGRIVGVADGDTVTLIDANNSTTKIRLHQIDAPEKQQDFGQRSKASLSDLVFGKEVDVEVVTIDKYGRTVGRIHVGGQDANLEQVRRGMAWVYRKYADEPIYFKAEQSARESEIGLWSHPDAVAPWVFRHPPRLVAANSRQGQPMHMVNPQSQFSCDTKRYCSQMGSREEAQYFLNQCGMQRLDRDGDGVACENL
jgi:endonuclease YncB( thermonuclease family)